jgi:hypothetical protein
MMNEKGAIISTHAFSISRSLNIHGAQTFFHSFMRVLNYSVPLSMAWIKDNQVSRNCNQTTPFQPAPYFFHQLVMI